MLVVVCVRALHYHLHWVYRRLEDLRCLDSTDDRHLGLLPGQGQLQEYVSAVLVLFWLDVRLTGSDGVHHPCHESARPQNAVDNRHPRTWCESSWCTKPLHGRTFLLIVHSDSEDITLLLRRRRMALQLAILNDDCQLCRLHHRGYGDETLIRSISKLPLRST